MKTKEQLSDKELQLRRIRENLASEAVLDENALSGLSSKDLEREVEQRILGQQKNLEVLEADYLEWRERGAVQVQVAIDTHFPGRDALEVIERLEELLGTISEHFYNPTAPKETSQFWLDHAVSLKLWKDHVARAQKWLRIIRREEVGLPPEDPEPFKSVIGGWDGVPDPVY